MPAARVRLRAMDVSRLEHALECRDAVLLVELRALREIGHAVEVLDREQVRAALGAGRHDLGGDDLREVARREELAEGGEQSRLHAERVAGVQCKQLRSARAVPHDWQCYSRPPVSKYYEDAPLVCSERCTLVHPGSVGYPGIPDANLKKKTGMVQRVS